MTPALPIKLMRCRHGPMFVLVTDFYVGGALEAFGEYSEAEVALLARLLHPGDVVVEAGANTGAHTIPLAQCVGPTGRVISYEPQRVLFNVMRANLALNNLSPIVDARREAVSEVEGTLDVPCFDFSLMDNFGGFGELTLLSFTESARKPAVYDTVPACTIDSLRLPACALIKADVEGMELALIGGALETLQRCRPIVYLEAHGRQSSPLLVSLDAMDYQLWRHSPPLFSETNYRGDQNNPWPGVVSVNVLGLPKGYALAERIVAEFSLRRVADPFRDRA